MQCSLSCCFDPNSCKHEKEDETIANDGDSSHEEEDTTAAGEGKDVPENVAEHEEAADQREKEAS